MMVGRRFVDYQALFEHKGEMYKEDCEMIVRKGANEYYVWEKEKKV